MADGDLERSRKFVRFLFEPAQNVALVQSSRVGATTLREQEGLESIPANLQAAHFRTFPIDKILLERDERIRLADELLEQTLLGAAIKVVKVPEVTKPVAEIAVATPRPKPKPKPTPEPSEDAAESMSELNDEAAGSAAESPAQTPTAPSESIPHDD